MDRLENIAPESLLEFREHTFQIREDEDMEKLIVSIRENGILEPIIAFENEDHVPEIITGHRRRYAALKLGIPEVPVLIKAMTREDASILMCESNLKKREKLLPSERANSYRLMIDAMNRKQGQRDDLSGEEKGKSTVLLSNKIGESARNIENYLRILFLIPELLNLVDLKKIAMLQATDLSFLSVEAQKTVYEIVRDQGKSPSHNQTRRMKALSDRGELDEKKIRNIMAELKANQLASAGMKISNLSLLSYKEKAHLENEEFQELLVRALDYYLENQSETGLLMEDQRT